MMDPELRRTAEQGDVENLIKLCETRCHEFFLAQESQNKWNMLQILCHHGKQAFADEAISRLPMQVVRQLICQTDIGDHNSFHHAAFFGFPNIAKLLVDAYRSSDDGMDMSCPPWRAKNALGKLPVNVAVDENHDEVAAFLVSVDPDSLSKAGSLLLDSASKGCRRTTNAILTSGAEYSIKDFNAFYIKELAKNCSESDAVLLLQQHPELVKHPVVKFIMLRLAMECNLVDVVRTILDFDISVSYTLKDEHEDRSNLLHIAARLGRLEIAQLLVDTFNKFCKRQVQREREALARSNSRTSFEIEDVVSLLSFQPPWRQTNIDGITPLHEAFCHGHRKLAASMLSWDLAFLSDLADIYEDPPIIPVFEQEGFREATERYLASDVKCSVMDVYLEVFLQFLRENPDNKTRKLIIQHQNLIELKDTSGRTILQYALDEDDVPVMCLILKTYPSAIDIQDGEQENLLIKACRKGNMPAIHAICAVCPQTAALHGSQTTALHNVRLRDLEEYRSLLDIPQIVQFKNKTDALGQSPLIKAILDNNIHLAQALLELDGIDLMNIKSKEGKTAAGMLKDKSKESVEWDILYKKVKQATSFIPLGTDLKEMRNTLSVVAALLATITFAAAFTVPGGFDQNNGDVLLGQRASFIVFILSDTYAMCCSMIVLYSLIWSMVWDSKQALLLIDRSVFVLHQSLYGTLVAFMTGVYTMVSHKSLWVAIVVCFMCSCVPISANRTILITILDKFVPPSRSEISRGLVQVSVQQH